jgi:hypothetical protein
MSKRMEEQAAKHKKNFTGTIFGYDPLTSLHTIVRIENGILVDVYQDGFKCLPPDPSRAEAARKNRALKFGASQPSIDPESNSP